MAEPERGKIFDWEYVLYPDNNITANFQDGNSGAYLYLFLPGTEYGGESGMVFIKPTGNLYLQLSLFRASQLHSVMLECLNKLNKSCVTHPQLSLPETD